MRLLPGYSICGGPANRRVWAALGQGFTWTSALNTADFGEGPEEEERATSEMAAREGSAPGRSVKGREMNRGLSAGSQAPHCVRRAVPTGNQGNAGVLGNTHHNETGARWAQSCRRTHPPTVLFTVTRWAPGQSP